MTDKTIKELIEEAQDLGIDIRDHVAKEMFGTVNGATRRQAKRLTFCYLYGGTGRTSRKDPDPQSIPIREPNIQKCPWTMTEEQIKAQSKIPVEFKNEWMGEPFEPGKEHPPTAVLPFFYRPPTTEQEIRQAEGRMHRSRPPAKHPQAEDRIYRGGVVPYKVKVFNDEDNTGNYFTYTVHATSDLDARCMAFVLDGGCQGGLKHWDEGYIELALTYTEIVA